MEKNHTAKDEQIMAEYLEKQPWGMSATVDLKNCDPDIMRDAEKIKQFVVELCDLIAMKRFGETVVVNFGEDPRVSGFSMTQLIETSLISGHFADQTNAIYLDVFSCKEYPPYKTAEFCKIFFKAESYKVGITYRY